MQLTEEEKYKRPDFEAGDLTAPAAVAGYVGAKKLGGGSAIQGLKKTAEVSKKLVQAGIDSHGGGLKGAGKFFGAVGAAGSALYGNAKTPSEDYYERFGLEPYNPDRGFMNHLGIRALGFASDLGNGLSLGLAGKYLYRDKIRQANETAATEKAKQTPSQATPTQDAYQEENSEVVAPTYKSALAEGLGIQGAKLGEKLAQQGGIAQTPNYQALINKANADASTLSQGVNLNLRATGVPQRDAINEAQRKDLMQKATTVHKGAHGLTAAQMRLAHDLSNDDIKLAQERHLQQNNLNHQLIQEAIQQEGQNARTLANEKGQNARFSANLGLDTAKFQQDAQNSQYELGLKGAELASRLANDEMAQKTQAETMRLYDAYVNSTDDKEKDKILTQLAVLTGKGGGGGDAGGYATINLGEYYDPETQTTINQGQALYNTKTGEMVGVNQKQGAKANVPFDSDENLAAFQKEIAGKKLTGDELKAVASKYGIPAELLAHYLGEK